MRDASTVPTLIIGETRGTVTSTVTEADTAQTLGSGDVPVLGTPRVIALAEAACMSALTRRMPTNLTTVGSRVELTHLVPAVCGDLVTAQATLASREGRRLTFDIVVTGADGTVLAQGQFVRILLDRAAFLSGTKR
ncbi:thioesterase family protein [Stackebrandtia soli]|uniref:thioesterase family protein n=1 Tax=Stackebrandtia soli TaxID=1892856 RepID=UPI0039E80BBB